MGPVLKGLTKLQSIENRLRAAKAKLARCRRSVIVQENQIRSLQNAFEAKKEEVQLIKVQADRLELEMKSRDELVSKIRASLNTAKTNKEYAALLTQLNMSKADNTKVENQVLELFKDIEADEAEKQKIQEQIDHQKHTLDDIRKHAEVDAEKYEAEIQEVQSEWDAQAKTLGPKELEVFKRVAETYDGEAIAIINEQDGKNGGYSCGGCFMGITAESVNLLMTKDEIIRCPNCTRILVLNETQE